MTHTAMADIQAIQIAKLLQTGGFLIPNTKRTKENQPTTTMIMNPFLPIRFFNPITNVEDNMLININHILFIRKDESTGGTIIMLGTKELTSISEYELIRSWIDGTYEEHNLDFLSKTGINQNRQTEPE